MTAPIRCRDCGHRVGPRGRAYFFPAGPVLCSGCVIGNWPRLHRKHFPGCPHWHSPADHSAVLATPAGIRYLLYGPPSAWNDTATQTLRQ